MSLARVPAQARYAVPPRPGPSIREIQDVVCTAWDVTRLDLLGRRRPSRLVAARHVAMWLVRWQTPCSYPEIGRAFRRDHTSVMHGVSGVERRMAGDEAFAARVRRLAAALDGADDDARRTGAG